MCLTVNSCTATGRSQKCLATVVDAIPFSKLYNGRSSNLKSNSSALLRKKLFGIVADA